MQSDFSGLLILAAILYFFPTIIALVRWRPNLMAIFALNLFLGWSVIGWVIALVWSLSATASVVAVAAPVDTRGMKKMPGLRRTDQEGSEEVPLLWRSDRGLGCRDRQFDLLSSWAFLKILTDPLSRTRFSVTGKGEFADELNRFLRLPGYAASLSPPSPTRAANDAAMNSSRSPSSTFCGSLRSTPVRRSFTI